MGWSLYGIGQSMYEMLRLARDFYRDEYADSVLYAQLAKTEKGAIQKSGEGEGRTHFEAHGRRHARGHSGKGRVDFPAFGHLNQEKVVETMATGPRQYPTSRHFRGIHH